MNGHIKELAEQAHEYVASSNAKNLRKVFEKKFAELIVKECVLEAMDAVHHNASIRLQLYEHFGVNTDAN